TCGPCGCVTCSHGRPTPQSPRRLTARRGLRAATGLAEESQPAGSREYSEVSVAGHQADVVVDAVLRNQCVSQTCAAPQLEDLGAQRSCSLPVPVEQLQTRERKEKLLDPIRKFRVAQDLREHHRGKTGLAVAERLLDEIGIAAAGPLEEGD